jgi:hypothetical protein
MCVYIFYFLILAISLFYIKFKNIDIFPYLHIIKKLIFDKYNDMIINIEKYNESILPVYNKIKLFIKYIIVMLLHYINKFQYYYIELLPNYLIFNYYNNLVFINNDMLLSDSDSDSEYSNMDESDSSINSSNSIVESYLYKRHIHSNDTLTNIINNYNLYNNLYPNCSKYNIVYAGLYYEDKITDYYHSLITIDDIYQSIQLYDSLNINLEITNNLIYLINLSQEINLNLINKYININKYKYLLIYYTNPHITNENLYNSLKFKIIDIDGQKDMTIDQQLFFGNIKL